MSCPEPEELAGRMGGSDGTESQQESVFVGRPGSKAYQCDIRSKVEQHTKKNLRRELCTHVCSYTHVRTYLYRLQDT